MNELNKLLIIDGSFLLHRALHLSDVFELKNSKGFRTGGIFQFLRMLNKEVREGGQYFPVVVFDMGLADRRTKLDPDYKNARERAKQDQMVLTPEESDIDYVKQYRKQRNLLNVILPYFGIPVLKFPGWEGDDLIYILSKVCEECVILTDDRDMLQLLSEKVTVMRPKAEEYVTLDKFLAENGYTDIHDFVIYKALLGDNSDNIPSAAKGVGKATVNDMVKLVKPYLNMRDAYPRDPESLKSICQNNGIKYRKAFLNWDLERFDINLQLVDLSLVKVEPRFLDSIKATISNSEQQCSYFKAIKALADLEITDFDLDSLVREVKLRRAYLWKAGDN